MKTCRFYFIFLAVDVTVFHFQESFRKIRIGINTNITPRAVRGNDLTECEKISFSDRILLEDRNNLAVFKQDFRSHQFF